MNKKRMNCIITLSLAVLYVICAGLSFNICYSKEGRDFENASMNYVNLLLDNINNIIYSDGGAQNLDELQEQLATAYTEFYPSYYGVYDEHGKLVFKNSSYIQSDDIGFIPVDANDEVTEQYLLFDKELTSYPVIDKFCYVTENNKILPTKLYFVSADESIDKNASKVIVLSNKKSTGEYISKTDFLGFTSNISYNYNKVNKKIKNDLIDLYSNKNVSVSDIENTGGYNGCDEAKYTSTFELDGKKYYFIVHVKHSLFYDTLISQTFKNSIYNQTFLFLIVAVVLFVTLNKMFDKNEKLNQARQAFTSAAAHELKTPITIINNQCECLMENVAPEKQQEYISNIYRQNRHMSSLVGNLLQYNRIDFGKIQKTKFDFKIVCLEELEKYESLIENKNLSIDTSEIYDDEMTADEKLIRLVVDNYISNAIKYTPNGKNLKISYDKYKGFIVFNEGSHIDEADKNKIWEVFNRSVGDEVIESSGMGLAVCKKILDAHKFKYGFNNLATGVEFYFKTK